MIIPNSSWHTLALHSIQRNMWTSPTSSCDSEHKQDPNSKIHYGCSHTRCFNPLLLLCSSCSQTMLVRCFVPWARVFKKSKSNNISMYNFQSSDTTQPIFYIEMYKDIAWSQLFCTICKKSTLSLWFVGNFQFVVFLLQKNQELSKLMEYGIIAVAAYFLTCSAFFIQVGSNGMTGNMYSNGYNIDVRAMTLIDNAL